MTFEVHAATGLLVGARQVLSPHFDARPAATPPDLLVIHGISLPPGEFGGPWIDRLFAGDLPRDAHPYFATIAGRVSAHLLIRRTGEVVQFVPFVARAWHAGTSSHKGRSACNDFSIGIELEGIDSEPYEGAQYEQLAAIIQALRAGVPSLGDAEIVGHSDVAPGRKTDPGESFDWARLKALLGN
jgi:AmpD protein